MKKMFFLVILCLFLLLGCSRNIAQPLSTGPIPSEHQTDSASESIATNCQDKFDIIYKQGENFVIYTNQSQNRLRYYIIDNCGEMIDCGFHDMRGGFDIYCSEENPQVLVVYYGAGGNAWSERYCNVANGKISRFFHRPIANNGKQIAYFEMQENLNIVLVVQDIFNPDAFYKEVKRDFSDWVIKDLAYAEFLSDNTQLKVTYWKNPNNEQITEIIDLY